MLQIYSGDKMKLLTFLLLIVSSTFCFSQVTWINQNSGTNNILTGVSFVDQNNGWACGGLGTLLHTSDGGEHWEMLSLPVNAYTSIKFIDLMNGWVTGLGGVIMHTTDGGENWNYQENIGGYLNFNSIFFINADSGWAAGGGEVPFPGSGQERLIEATTNGGDTWDVQYFQDESSLSKIYFTDNNNGYALGGAYVMHSTNGGNVWTQSVITGKIFDGICFIDNNTGWLAGKSGVSNYAGLIYKTTNGGNVWNGTIFGYNENLYDICFSDQQHGWAVGANDQDGTGIIYATTNGGNSWLPQNIPAVNSLHSVYFVNNNSGWAVGDNGTIISTFNPVPVELTSFSAGVDGNNVDLSWQTATETNNSGFEIQRSDVRDQKSETLDWKKIGFIKGQGTTTKENNYSFVDKNLGTGSYSYKLFQIDFDGTRTESEIVNVNINSQPKEYALMQNYPNPFNPTTTIEYSIPENGNVKLKIYNSLGEEVATLVNEYKTARSYKINFDASTLPSGVYYYKIITEKFSSVKKMILLK